MKFKSRSGDSATLEFLAIALDLADGTSRLQAGLPQQPRDARQEVRGRGSFVSRGENTLQLASDIDDSIIAAADRLGASIFLLIKHAK